MTNPEESWHAMTLIAHPTATEMIRRAAARAALAPSVHNTQPWRFVLTGDTLEIYADNNRQLRILDPTRRQLLISCGCALMNARVSLAAAGYEAEVVRFPEPDTRPGLLARITIPSNPADFTELGRLDTVIELRRSNRREFREGDVPADIVADLMQAAATEGARLFAIRDADHRMATAVLSQKADEEQNKNPAYRAELRAWTTDDPRRRDGVPAMAVPHVDAGSGDELPIRDFDTRGSGWLPTVTRSTMNQCLLLLGTDADAPLAWLRCGEALERLWLEATRHGYAASLLTQVAEVPTMRARLRSELGLTMYPHVLLRVGRAATTPASHRRRIEDVLTETYSSDPAWRGGERSVKIGRDA
jgi:hypothetical protein